MDINEIKAIAAIAAVAIFIACIILAIYFIIKYVSAKIKKKSHYSTVPPPPQGHTCYKNS